MQGCHRKTEGASFSWGKRAQTCRVPQHRPGAKEAESRPQPNEGRLPVLQNPQHMEEASQSKSGPGLT